ncbi:hypothetical protein HDE_11274 [Halotydeus destructor]|nr:hypothetical protein HDE_11274 [Halotydeus destructor]
MPLAVLSPLMVAAMSKRRRVSDLVDSLNDISASVVKQDVKLSTLEKDNANLRAELAKGKLVNRKKTTELENKIKELKKEVKELTCTLNNRNRTVKELFEENSKLRAKRAKSVQFAVNGSSSKSVPNSLTTSSKTVKPSVNGSSSDVRQIIVDKNDSEKPNIRTSVGQKSAPTQVIALDDGAKMAANETVSTASNRKDKMRVKIERTEQKCNKCKETKFIMVGGDKRDDYVCYDCF